MQAAKHALANAGKHHPVAMADCAACAATFHQVAELYSAGCNKTEAPKVGSLSGVSADLLWDGSAAEQHTKAAAANVSCVPADGPRLD